MRTSSALLVVALTVLAVLIACGGGGGSSTSISGTSTSQPQVLSISTNSLLPGTLQGHAYSATLTATGGQSALHWSLGIDQFHPSSVPGLSLDPSTGVLSGTPSFLGTGGFLATVTDSASPPQSASKSFTIQVSTPLSVDPAKTITVGQYNNVFGAILSYSGGVAPITYTLDRSCLPTALKAGDGTLPYGTSTAILSGVPITSGTFQCLLTLQDSFSPPESGRQLLTIVVQPRTLSLSSYSLPSKILLNRPFSGSVVAIGGVPPYIFSMTSGSLPPGLGPLEPTTGRLTGTPTTKGNFTFTVQVTDASSIPQSTSSVFGLNVVPLIGRNDTPSTATAIANGSFSASISPYIDPPNGPPLPGDNDYYKVVSRGGATVHVQTYAKGANSANPLDTVLEIVDGNGVRFNTCRQPGDTSSNFSSSCINDDITVGVVQDSSLDFKVPGPTNAAAAYYIHVLDWRGDARVDMTYSLNVTGLVAPLAIDSSHVLAAWRGQPYSGSLGSTNGSGAVTWSLDTGLLPPGIALSSAGVFSGSATADGTYSFTVRATDSANPPQSVTAPVSIVVGEPLVFTSPATWPDACQNQFYSFAVQTSGGVPPVNFVGFQSSNTPPYWPGLSMHMLPGDYYDGVFTGTPVITGTCMGMVSVRDATGRLATQGVTVTVKTCP